MLVNYAGPDGLLDSNVGIVWWFDLHSNVFVGPSSQSVCVFRPHHGAASSPTPPKPIPLIILIEFSAFF